jgi:hypothetical protein
VRHDNEGIKKISACQYENWERLRSRELSEEQHRSDQIDNYKRGLVGRDKSVHSRERDAREWNKQGQRQGGNDDYGDGDCVLARAWRHTGQRAAVMQS